MADQSGGLSALAMAVRHEPEVNAYIPHTPTPLHRRYLIQPNTGRNV